ncbi:YlbF family regulator [Streptococcus devriesei]|uniref:YlbF family regulator n=1 Tax=Streptococcus devriesei TaxID=231233 RepID=UPI000413057D|nr:YlbF family regulator [Streptococcus devriesei]
MNSFEEALETLVALLRKHDSVTAYQAVEKKIKSLPELSHLAHEMKAYQQDAVLFQKIEKAKAQKKADQQAEQLGKDLDGLPIVQDYRAKMQDASDLLQYVTKTLEDRINEELGND